jgi:flagellar export protein FliJ
MRRFKFRLEAVLKHRETIETLREQDFAMAQGRALALQAQITRLQDECRQTVLGIPVPRSDGNFDPEAFLNRERYVEVLRQAIQQHERELEAAQLVAEVCRKELVLARQAREAVLQLREKAFSMHQTVVAKMAQAALDELATLRHVRALNAERAGEHAMQNTDEEAA